jgi:glycerate 2-kinase
MRILIAPDKFKDACTAYEVAKSISEGILQTLPEAEIELLPLADGGEGTLLALEKTLKGKRIETATLDALCRPINAEYLWLEDSKTAIIEMSRTAGIELLSPAERNASKTSSMGTGIQIKDALESGAETIILTVGGTACNDAGLGIATALGYAFKDKAGNILDPVGESLQKIYSIEASDTVNAYIFKLKIVTDVENPMHGLHGAAHVYAKQKGASPEEILALDEGLVNFCSILQKQSYRNPSLVKGAGAGGGVSGGLYALFSAEISSGADWVLDECAFEEKLQEADILISGEGKIDRQTWHGKLISKVLEKSNKPVILICGTLEDIDSIPQLPNLLHISSIIHKPMDLLNALKNTNKLLLEHGMILGRFIKNQRF